MTAPSTAVAAATAADLLRLEDALERMLAGVEPLPVELVPLEDAVGLVVGEPVSSLLTVPPWNNSAMDGFAVRAADVARAQPDRPVSLRVVGEVAAGHAPDVRVDAGTAVRVLTGGMIPPGADAVVPVEDTDAEPGLADLPSAVEIRASAVPGAHVRSAGSDVSAGERLLVRGQVVRVPVIALLAATGHAAVPVHRRPRVAVVGTGDELVPAGEPLAPGQIHDSNSIALAAQARLVGADVRLLGIAPDSLDEVTAMLRDALSWADAVVVSGGVSVGAHDVVKAAFESLGRLHLWRVAVQPGKPVAHARAPRTGLSDALLFGLPGNPVSSFVTFELFVRPVLRRLAGHADPVARPRARARLGSAVTKSPNRRAFLRVRLERDTESTGGLVAQLAGGQGSHVLSALASAEALAVIPEDVPGLPAGAEVEVWPLDTETGHGGRPS